MLLNRIGISTYRQLQEFEQATKEALEDFFKYGNQDNIDELLVLVLSSVELNSNAINGIVDQISKETKCNNIACGIDRKSYTPESKHVKVIISE